MTLPKGLLHDGFKVWTQEEVRLVRATATLFDFDVLPGSRFLLVSPTLLFSRLVVPVFEGEKKIGAASLFGAGRKVVALISFDYETPERLDLDLNRPVYASPRGDFFLDPSPQAGYTVDYIDVAGVDLSTTASDRKGASFPLCLTQYREIEG